MHGADFATWVAKTYGNPDRDWVRRNLPALEKAFREGLSPRPSRTVEPARTHDRYSEI